MAVTVVDKIKAPSWIYQREEKPSVFRTTLEKEKYWATQKKRWIEGYKGIPGPLYFAAQECLIKDRTEGNMMRPMVRDVDLMVYEALCENWKNGFVSGIVKCRGSGLSTIGGVLANYFMVAYPGSTSLITSKDTEGIKTMFSEKITPTLDLLDSDFSPIEKNRSETKQYMFYAGEVYYKRDGKPTMDVSQIKCRETSEKPDSPTNFSSSGAKFGFYDEFPLHKRAKELLESSIECYKKEGRMTGMLVWGGTVEAKLTNLEISNFEKMVTKSKTIDTDIIFIPFWMGKNMVNGHSNEKLGREQWEKAIEAFQKAGDESGERAYRKNNPWSLDDIFAMGQGTRWEDDVADKIKVQLDTVKANPPIITTCNLIERETGIETFITKEGKIQILEHPKNGVEYGLVADGIATGTKHGSEKGSDAAFLIMKLYDPQGLSFSPVARYVQKPKSVEDTYFQGTTMAKYYNKFGGLKWIAPEANAATIDHYSTYLFKQGMHKYLQRKRDLTGRGNVNTAKVGQYIGDNERDWQMRQANPFLRARVGDIWWESLLVGMLTPEDSNCDELDAWLMFFIAAGIDFDKPQKKESTYEHEVRVMDRRPDGTVYWKYEKRIMKISK